MAKKKNWKEVEDRVNELAKREKNDALTDAEKIEIFQKREELRRREVKEQFAKLKADLEQGKKDALLKILEENGIKTENDLKKIFRFVQDTKPELFPAKPKPEGGDGDAKENGGGATEGDAENATEQTEEPKNENGDEGTGDADSQTGEAPICENCGTQAIRKYSKRKEKEYWICPNYSDNDKNHYFKWLD